MKNDGNASLIEITIAALILVGSTALVSTMTPDVRALEPATSEQGYMASVMDAFVLSGEDPATVVADAWAGTPSVWFNEVLGDYSLYLVTGHDRILIHGAGNPGSSAMTSFVSQVTLADLDDNLNFTHNEVYTPGQVIYSSQPLEEIVGFLDTNEEVDQISHLTKYGTPSPFYEAKQGENWLSIWNDALDNGTIPSEIPYGVWQATIPTWIIYPIPGVPETVTWYVLNEPNAITAAAHYAVYGLEVVA